MSADEQDADAPAGEKPRARPRTLIGLVLALVGAVWATQLHGIASSNDGSHIALARALALRGRPEIDGEEALTLLVDRARRDGHSYSDRPPGTAFAALPATRLASGLDERWLQVSLDLMKADPPPRIEDTLVVRPATQAYVETYGARRQKVPGPSPNLLALQGTAAMVGAHSIALGLVGLALVVALLRRRLSEPVPAIAAVSILGCSTLWGAYSTVLFSHVTAGVALIALVYGLERTREAEEARGRWVWGAMAGLAGSWAVSADYALLVAVVPLTVLLSPPVRWPAILLGAVPVTLATLAYHDAAFGSPFSIGYDHQTNFAFARDRGSTFSGNPLQGLWSLWGAGILLQSPIVLLGVYGLARSAHRRWLYGLLPWMALLVFHQTPWGGATEDYRYLVPALPPLAVGLGLAWQREVIDRGRTGRFVGLGIVVVASISAVTTWAHFWAWRG